MKTNGFKEMSTNMYKRLIVDFFGYLVFLGSSYILFATNMAFRFFLIPVTFFAFFKTLKNRHEEAFSDGFAAAGEILGKNVDD